jgi:transposase-like protein
LRYVAVQTPWLELYALLSFVVLLALGLIACTDNLTGFSQAIEAVFPKTDIQNCIIHQLRNSSKYVSYKDIKALMADLKKVYTATTEEAALDALDEFAAAWDGKYPKIPPLLF